MSIRITSAKAMSIMLLIVGLEVVGGSMIMFIAWQEPMIKDYFVKRE